MNKGTGPQPLFLGEVVLLAEDLLGTSAEELALALPEGLLESAPHRPIAGIGPDVVDEAAQLWERVIRERWFGDDSRQVGAACVRALLDPESELWWPDAALQEFERVGKKLEAGEMNRLDLGDWIGSWRAQTKQRQDVPTA